MLRRYTTGLWTWKPPAGVEPALQPYEGCVLPLTPQRRCVEWRRQESNPHSLGASEVLLAVELRPRRETKALA